MNIFVYDLEVFPSECGYWVAGFADLSNNTFFQIESYDDLLNFYNDNHKSLFVGYNNRHYDDPIFKALLMGQDPFPLSQHLISGGNAWSYSKSLNEIPLRSYDTSVNFKSLKQLEGFLGLSIEESSISFDIKRPLTEEEKEEVKSYNKHDVLCTIEVLKNTWNDFKAQMMLLKMFDLPLSYMSKTKAQLTAEALGCRPKKFDDENEYTILDCIQINKYTEVLDWFKSKKCLTGEKLVVDVAGIPHTFGLGGVHAGEKVICDKNILHCDVTSFYPSIMIEHDLQSRTVKDKQRFKNIKDIRIKLKEQGKKAEQAPLKIVINGAFGISKDKFSKAYDPRRATEICVNGQLMLLDLIEKVEPYCKIIQSNTDGIYVSYTDYDNYIAACREWEQRTKMNLSHDKIDYIYQKDVNNYFTNVERKGAYVKELSPLDYDLPIINKAVSRYLTDNVPVERTIYNCNDLMEFQKIVKIGGMYDYCVHNNKRYNLKVYRVFASKDLSDTTLYKKKDKGNRQLEFMDAELDKVGNTPDHLFIDNGYVKHKPLPPNLDIEWYVKEANKRLKEFI